MSHLHLTRTRTRERTPDYDTYYARPLVRRDSKRQRLISLNSDDEGQDDYPYSSSHRPAKTSRALTLRNQPSQLERYNIWSTGRDRYTPDDSEDERRRSYERRNTYKHRSSRHHYSDDHDDLHGDPEERAFRLKVQASISRPKSSHHHHHTDTSSLWPSDMFRRKEKWIDEDWETRERSVSRERTRRDSLWGDDVDKGEESESWSRFRRIKRTKTEEFRPLSAWRRDRIVYGS